MTTLHIYPDKLGSKYLLIILFALLFALIPQDAFAATSSNRKKSYDDYIMLHKDLAISHMKRFGIPASITLAQGLLESGAGKGSLTLKSNNHFGIKCHTDWKGESVIAADDKPNDCFRKYKKAEDSFEDHSIFLSKPRYKALYELDIADYKGWAKGLQSAGYATDKAYANKLIKLIEDYELYKHDKKGSYKKTEREAIKIVAPKGLFKHTPYKTHGLVYVVAENDDTYKSIAKEFDFKLKDLCKYNEVPEDYPLQGGELVYFQKKKTKADKPYYEHVVGVGESMYSISQLYGLRVKNIYKMNKLDDEYVPVEGDVLRLR